ncbi:MAG TPA: discoidin domain-containing protein, partial [Cyclobacteriaceae bacterium]|nr:discoidin domain-containing protein [Cyclobacteriaceae bacterium]
GECDVSVRPGWFYHASQDNLVKSPRELVDLYYKSVGRNATLLLNIPPDPRGQWHETDIKNLKEFRSILDETFHENLALGKRATSSDHRMKNNYFSPGNITDPYDSTYWATNDNVIQSWVEIDLGKRITFDRITVREPIRFGQRISSFRVEARLHGEWATIARGTTIGFKRLLRIAPVKTDKLRLVIEEANNIPAVSDLGLYKASYREPNIID